MLAVMHQFFGMLSVELFRHARVEAEAVAVAAAGEERFMVFLDEACIHQVDAAQGLSRSRKQFIDKVADVLMQLLFQQSKVFGCLKFSSSTDCGQFSCAQRRSTHSANCAENRWFPLRLLVDVPVNRQQRRVPAAHPCLVQIVQKNVEIPQVQSAVTVEVPQIRSRGYGGGCGCFFFVRFYCPFRTPSGWTSSTQLGATSFRASRAVHN